MSWSLIGDTDLVSAEIEVLALNRHIRIVGELEPAHVGLRLDLAAAGAKASKLASAKSPPPVAALTAARDFLIAKLHFPGEPRPPEETGYSLASASI